MSPTSILKPLREYSTFAEAQAAAIDVASHTYSVPVQGTLYMQGGRRFISIVLPMEFLFNLTHRPAPRKKGEPTPDPSETRNRPLNHDHVKDISLYVRKNDSYLIPPVIMNVQAPLDIFTLMPSEHGVRPCMIVLPKSEALYVTDGQHRIEGLRSAITEKPALYQDAVGITIIEEMDLQRVHQDFYDAAQTKKLEPSLLVEYDGRSFGNALTRFIIEHVPLFAQRTERIGNNIGKNSLMLYSTNQIKGALFRLILGETTGKTAATLERVNQKIAPAYDVYTRSMAAFFVRMTALNVQWRTIMERPVSEAYSQDPVPEMRGHYVHLTGGGLNVMCTVGHDILTLEETISEQFSPQQDAMLERLATLDWSRSGDLWRGHLVSTSGSITPHRGNLLLASASVKDALGLDLSKKERHALERAEVLVSSTKEAR